MMTTEVTNTVDIAATPDDVWAVLADLPATRSWLPGVVTVRMDGDVRICTMADGPEIHERITDVSPGRRSYRFEHLRVPLPVRHSFGTFTVTAEAGVARVTLVTTFDAVDPAATEAVTEMIDTAFGQALESLRRYVEEKITWDA